MKFSVIIPTLNEKTFLGSCIDDIRRLDPGTEIIVADGGSTDGTDSVAAFKDVRLCLSQPGRGLQCNSGAGLAAGEVLIFLHADTRLPEDAFHRLADIFTDDRVQFGTFRINFDIDHWFLKFISFISVCDLGIFRFGDQCFVVRKSFFQYLGGFCSWRLFEDMEFFRRARKKTRALRFPMPITTSSRRFVSNGIIRQQLKNTWLTVQYVLGASPVKLALRYYSNCTELNDQSISEKKKSERNKDAGCDRISRRKPHLNLPGGVEQWTSL